MQIKLMTLSPRWSESRFAQIVVAGGFVSLLLQRAPSCTPHEQASDINAVVDQQAEECVLRFLGKLALSSELFGSTRPREFRGSIFS